VRVRTFTDRENLEPIGYSALIEHYDIKTIPHNRSSYIALHGRARIILENNREIHLYTKGYRLNDPQDSLQQLEFAIKYDGVNLEILTHVFSFIPSDTISQYILEKPTSKYRRKIWYLYELITDQKLNVPDQKNIHYVDLLDCEQYFTSGGIKSKRHAVNNNLLGDQAFCPMIRKTDKIAEYIDKNLSKVTKDIIDSVDPLVLVRATHYLYTKETKSSFGIEHAKPDKNRIAKFIQLLEEAATIEHLDKDILLKLQNSIVEDPYRDSDYRNSQNYVGELTRLYREKIHYISPKPEDIHELMQAYLTCENKMFQSELHPVLLAAVLAFGFVFLHPFEDGNGRIHRFLIHYALSKTDYTPDNIIFPVSAVMLKNMKRYDAMLETFSKPLLQVIQKYELSDDGILNVNEKTKTHYQYIDYTHFAEYLFECIEQTITEDFKTELDFIQRYDKTKEAIRNIIDMPDIKIDRIIRCVTQNNGVLGKQMRKKYFAELSDDEIKKIEVVINKNMNTSFPA